MDVVRTQVFVAPGDRPNVANLAVIITDGKPTEPSEVPDAIDAVHASGIKTCAVGVTSAVDEATLRELSSEPKQASILVSLHYLFYV